MGLKDISYGSWVGISAGFVVALVSALVIGLALLHPGDGATFGQVASFVLVGFAAFIMLMNVLSYAANALGMSDGGQPFGLPEGTVRAILTLSLMVLVGVLASFLITGQRHTSTEKSYLQRGLGEDEASAFSKTFVTANPSLATSISINPGTEQSKFDVVLTTKTEDRLSEDISKQILTMLSTVLAAMIGFYFGARGDSSTPTPADMNPSAEAAKALDLQRKATAALAKLPEATQADKDTKATVAGYVAKLGELRTRIEHWDIALAFPGASADAKAEAQSKKDEDKKQLDTIEDELGKLGV